MEEQPPLEPADGQESEDWLPPLVLMADYDHLWQPYIDAVYWYFCLDFVESTPRLNGCWVHRRRDPMWDGKEDGFWHCVSKGSVEADRTPDIRRCERIRWVRAVIENDGDDRVDVWENEREGKPRRLLWFDEEYLIVLASQVSRSTGAAYFNLVTAYTTTEEHRRRKLRKERDAYHNSGQ